MKAIRVQRKIKIGGVWKFLSLARKGGDLDWAHLVHNGTNIQVKKTEGTFYLDWLERKKRIRRAVGDSVREAKSALATQKYVVTLREEGVEAEDAPQIADRKKVAMDGMTLAEVIAEAKKNPPPKLRPKSVRAYNDALRAYLLWTKKNYLVEVNRDELLNFMGHLIRAEKLSPATAKKHGRIIHVVARRYGQKIEMERGDWPKVVEKERPVYEPEQLQALWKKATPEEYAVFQTLLLTGFRNLEVAFAAWPDFNHKKKTLSVKAKPEWKFVPKDNEERTVPIPDKLVDLLLAHKEKQSKGSYLIFGTSPWGNQSKGGQQDRHLLFKLRKLALRAGANCGYCMGSHDGKKVTRAIHPVCKQFGLHKFRHTYATAQLLDGVDIMTVKNRLGHSDIKTTYKYLRSIGALTGQEEVNRSSLVTDFG